MMFNIPKSYELLCDEKLEDLNGLGLVLSHKKTGARVALVANDDDNKVFYIGFRTPPKNSTGVAHIIEHSVLCGSTNFPAKDPFVELAKGSLNTFLNAMTYPDKTIYPVASVNDQDFKNLMHVYMDAVLYPNIYDRKEIFYQEGWHYELEDEADVLTYNGVVYNEMKGAFSSPESRLFRMIQHSLYPDTAYGVESGGDPEFIPELSYEEFLDFHKTFYHPSNSYIYLYGDMDFEERLNWLDQEYLAHFNYLEVDSEIQKQPLFKETREITEHFSIGEGESEGENTYLSMNTVIGDVLDKELTMAFQILNYVLLQAPGAPVKQALLDAGIGKDILAMFEDEILQPLFSITAKNADASQKEEFIKIIRTTLAKIAAEGVDEKSLRAAINFYEFRYREADYGQYPKGLMCGLKALGSWLYDDEQPFLHLKESSYYDVLKAKIATGYYESLITKYLLENSHTSVTILKPKQGLSLANEEETKKKLAAYKASLSKEEIQRIIVETKALKLYQEIPSTKEELEAIPLLEREDIKRETQPLYNEKVSIDGTDVIHHNLHTNEIAYIRLFFDLKDISKDLLPYVSVLSMVLGYVDTKNYSYLDLSNEVNINTGGIGNNVKSFSVKGNTNQYYPVFEFASKVLYDKMGDSFRLMEEIIVNTKLDDPKRLKEILSEMKSRMQMHFNSAGHSVAIDRGMSYYSAHGLFKEITTGIEFYKFLEELLEQVNERAEDVLAKLKGLIGLIFDQNKLFVSITADDTGCDLLRKHLPVFKKGLLSVEKTELNQANQIPLEPVGKNEGFKTAMQVQYVARVGNFMNAGLPYTGALKVLKTIFSYDYLWNNVRVKGGAYGCMCGFSGVDGDSYFVSYRDPNIRETVDIYKKAVEYVKNYEAEDRDITKNIIGTFSGLDTPLTPQGKGKRSLAMYIAGITEEDLRKEREEILNVDAQSIRSLAPYVEAVLADEYICVVGNEGKIEANKDLFKEVKSLIK